MATGLGADVTILDRDPEVLERVGTFFESRAKTRFANRANLAECVAEADLVIGAVLTPGAEAPKLVTRDMLRTMRSEEHTSELQSLMRISYAVFCLKKKIKQQPLTLLYHSSV